MHIYYTGNKETTRRSLRRLCVAATLTPRDSNGNLLEPYRGFLMSRKNGGKVPNPLNKVSRRKGK